MSLTATIGAYQGADFVTARAQDHVQGKSESILTIRPVRRILSLQIVKFKNSKFDAGDISEFGWRFEKGLKRTFSEDNKPQFVEFDSAEDDYGRCDVKGGKLTLQG